MGHALLKKAILLLKMANVPFDLLIAVYILSFLFAGSLGLTAGNVSPSELSASSPSPNSSQSVSNIMDPSSRIGKQNKALMA